MEMEEMTAPAMQVTLVPYLEMISSLKYCSLFDFQTYLLIIAAARGADSMVTPLRILPANS